MNSQAETHPNIAVVLIGRNEGERLIRCLASVPDWVEQIVYVDSGSTDGSVAAATAAGARVVDLDTSAGFTAARARNAGYEVAKANGTPAFVQFVDGDCEINTDWIATAAAYLTDNPDVAVVCGRRRERFPERTVYNRLCDWEWDTQIGQAKACGGDAMMRCTVFEDVGGFDPTLIAGEEPELCYRIREAGWRVWRLDHEMTLHDADMTKLSQFWKRARRSGHASAEAAVMYGSETEPYPIVSTRRALMWAVFLPALIILGLLVTPLALLLLLAYPAQILRLAKRDGLTNRESWERAILMTVAKFPEAMGVLEYKWRRWRKRPSQLIEYK